MTYIVDQNECVTIDGKVWDRGPSEFLKKYNRARTIKTVRRSCLLAGAGLVVGLLTSGMFFLLKGGDENIHF